MKALKRAAGAVAGAGKVAAYLAGMFALGVAGLAVEAWKKRRQRKAAKRER